MYKVLKGGREQAIWCMLTQSHVTAIDICKARGQEGCLAQRQHDVMAWALWQPFQHAYDLLAVLCFLDAILHPLLAVGDAGLGLLPYSLSCMLQTVELMHCQLFSVPSRCYSIHQSSHQAGRHPVLHDRLMSAVL